MMRSLLLLLAACGTPQPPDDAPEDTDAPPDTDEPAGPVVAEAGDAVVTLVGEVVTLDPVGSAGATEARWSFGDGAGSARAAIGPVQHTWAAPGHYLVSLEVYGVGGRTATDTVEVTVTWPAVTPAPRSSSSVVAGSGRVFVALPDFDAVAVVDPVARTVVEHLRPCRAPRRLSYGQDEDGQGRLGVTCEGPGPGVVVYEIDPEGVVRENARVDLSGTGETPFGIVLAEDVALVTSRARGIDDGILRIYDRDLRAQGEPHFGRDLRGVAWWLGGAVVSQHRSPDTGGAFWRLDEDGTVHSASLAPDPGPDSDTNARGVPTYLQTAVIRPDGRAAVFAGQKANIGRGLVRDGLPLTHETTLRSDLRMVSLHPDEGRLDSEIGKLVLDDRDLISAAAFHPRGDWLYVLTLGSRTLEVVDAYSLRRVAVIHEVGIAPDGLAISSDGATAWVHGRWSRTLAFVDLSSGTDAPPPTLDLRPGGVEVLPADVVRGAQIFHTSSDPRMTQDGYVSCASCHLDGEDDGRTWDFTSRGEGLRNTISLRGMDERAGLPIHWSGNFDEVQDFEHDIRGPQAGRGFLSDADYAGPAGTTLGAPKAGLSAELDALAAYVEQLTVLEAPWTEDVATGRAIFEDPDVGCATCHPAGGSSSTWASVGVPVLVDVGTLGPGSGQRLGGALTGLDVPSLRGVWATAPYLHDGSAATLRDVIVGRNSEDAHGSTSSLGSGQLDALERYLRSL